MKIRPFIYIILTMGGFVLSAFSFEPSYQGRTLTAWLKIVFDTPLSETQKLQTAQTAVRSIGAKALPTLLRLIKTQDDPISRWLMQTGYQLRISDETEGKYRTWPGARVLSSERLGIDGFEILGTNAAPAVGELAKLLDNPAYVPAAEECLVCIGKPAEAVICQALTNQDWQIRQWGVDNLAAVTDDVGVYIDRIKPRLADSSDDVRKTTVNAIGIQTEAPDLAVPILIEALNDPLVSVSVSAVSSLSLPTEQMRP